MNQNRKKKNRKKETGAVVSLLLASSLAFGGCGTAVTSSSSVNAESARTESTGETSADNADTTSESTDSENAMESASDINFDLELTESTIDTEFTDREKSGSYKASEAVKITLNKTTATVSGSGAKADGSTITITEEGVYVVSGTLEDGQIIVDASDSDKFRSYSMESISTVRRMLPSTFAKRTKFSSRLLKTAETRLAVETSTLRLTTTR